MVDEERVTRLLARVRADIAALRLQAERPPEQLIADDTALAATKYRLITAIEGCTRAAHHIITSEGWDVADTNAGAIRELARKGVLTQGLGEVVSSAAGFRNVLVHQYVDVDDSKVVEHLARLDDLDDFVVSVLQWLESH